MLRSGRSLKARLYRRAIAVPNNRCHSLWAQDSPGGRRDLKKSGTEDNTNICDFAMPPTLCNLAITPVLVNSWTAEDFTGKVVGVHDGDTITVKGAENESGSTASTHPSRARHSRIGLSSLSLIFATTRKQE